MSIPRWSPRTTYTRQETIINKRLGTTRKLFSFLRAHRAELFDDGFQAELERMYRASGAGDKPIPPALLAMVCLLQAYTKVSDAEAVQLCVVDLRWQMVLDCLGAEEAPFSQGALCDFRNRLIAAELDARLLTRTVELAQQHGGFDARKMPNALRLAIDSAPLEGAGRVEDALNLLGHAARKVVICAAALCGATMEEVATAAGIPVVLAPSIKRGLDREWGPDGAMRDAVTTLVKQLDALETWLQTNLPKELARPPLQPLVATLAQLRAQDLEPDPSNGGTRIREGTAADRRISVEDPDMRHGRKSKSQRINGYKRHIAVDLDTRLIVSCAVAPANRPEQEALEPLLADLSTFQRHLAELYVDRGYIASPQIGALGATGTTVFCKPWIAQNDNGRFTKADFKIDIRRKTVTCPAGETRRIQLGAKVSFGQKTCLPCHLRDQCTINATHGRQLRIAQDEPLQKKLRALIASPRGRDNLRKRVAVEHRLAHLTRRQGRRARYLGERKNLFDVRRTAAVENLIVMHQTEILNAA